MGTAESQLAQFYREKVAKWRMVGLAALDPPYRCFGKKTHEANRMCLGIAGKVLETYQQESLPMGKVEFGGIVREVCLAYTPEVQVGEYVIVHVGFAISRLDEAEAREIFSYLDQIDALAESEGAPPGAAGGDRDAGRPAP